MKLNAASCRLKLKLQAIKRENDARKLKELNEELANLKEERNEFKAKWQKEKEIVDKITARKRDIENLKTEAEKAEREGDYGKVAEIRYGKVKDAETDIKKFEKELAKISPEKRIFRKK